MQILFGDEFFHRINRNGLINGAARTCVLTAPVTDAAADCGKRIVLFDQCQCIPIAPLCRHFQITLHSDMSRTRRLTRSRTCIITVLAIVITIIRIPHIRTPFIIIGQLMLRIVYLTVLGTQLLSQLYRSGGTHLNAFSACYTILGIDMSAIRGTTHIRGIE